MSYLLRSTVKFISARHLLQTTGGSCIKNVEPLSTLTFAMCQNQNPAHNSGGGRSANERRTNAQKKPREASIKITLIQNDNVTVTALEEARNLAKRRSMQLVQVEKMDSKTHRPVYKLLTTAERLQEEHSDLAPLEKSTDKANQIKSVKSLNIGSRISSNDLASRLKNISKWLGKRNEVRVLILGSEKDMGSCEKISKAIEESVQSPETIGRIVQKRTKGSVLKFSILPITPTGDDNVATSSPQ